MATVTELNNKVTDKFGSLLNLTKIEVGELTIEVAPENLLAVCKELKENPEFDFQMLVDVCGVDYLFYGVDEWQTYSATETGFERGFDWQKKEDVQLQGPVGPRFAAVYHLLSLNLNHRIRIRVRLDESNLEVPSVVPIWPSANWFEREAFDLYGIIFKDHPDLRRILTDYGFQGHPFRKDFPLSGNVEVRYDAKQQRVIYEPVEIVPRILEPKVIRKDNRYETGESN